MEERKIDFITAASIMLFAMSIDGSEAMFDLVSAVPIVGWFLGPPISIYISIAGGVGLASWFFYLGVPFVGRLGTAAIIEVIPFVNAVPAYSAAAMLTILAANNETLGGLLSIVTTGGAAAKVAGAAEGAQQVAKGATASALPAEKGSGGGAGGAAVSERQDRTTPAFKEPVQAGREVAGLSNVVDRNATTQSTREPGTPSGTANTTTPVRQQFSDTGPTSRAEAATQSPSSSSPSARSFQNVSDTSIAQASPRGGGVGIDAIAHPPAQPDPALGTSLESGLVEIEKRAKTNPNEIPHYFSRDKNGKGEWKTGPEGGKDHASMPTKELEALREAAKNGGSCAIVHTHPKSSGQNALPSIQDAIMENSVGKGCENIAVDSSGNRWKFETTDEFKKRHDAFEKKFRDMDNSVKGTPQEREWNAEAQKALAMRREGRFEDGLDHMIREGLSGKYGKNTQDRARELANDGIARTARDYNRDVRRGLTKEEAEHYIKRWGQGGFRITKS